MKRLDKTKWLLLALILLAFGLRVYRLGAQSLWSDEGLSLYRARLTVSENLTNVIVVPPGVPTQDANPPLYFIALSGARALLGESEYALRFLSVMAGVLIVPLLYVTGRRLFSPVVGVLAASLGALSPFFVWYSQEARMYALLAALSLASVYLLLRVEDLPARSDQPVPGRRKSQAIGRWWAWALVTAAALYTHFAAFFLLPFEALIMLAALIRSRRREAIVAGVVLAGLAIPLAAYGLSRVQGGIAPVFHFRPLNSITEELWSTFSIGQTNEIFQPLWAVAPALLMFTLGGLSGLIERPRRVASVLLSLGYVFAPFLLFYAATLIVPLYTGPRHLMLIAPPFYLLVGNGLAFTWRRLRLVGLAALVWIAAAMLIWLRVQFFDPDYIKEDIRSAVRAISQQATAHDVVIVHDAISSFVFDYYYTGVAPWTIIPTYPVQDEEAALKEFQSKAESADRVWFLTDPQPLGDFPRGLLDAWARGHLLRLGHQRFPSMWLGSAYQLYTAHFPIFETLPASAERRDLTWPAYHLHLVGIDPVKAAPDASQAQVTLYWQIDDKPASNIITTLRWIDSPGAEWGLEISTPFDNWPARQWPIGKIVEQVATIKLRPDMPAGKYQVQLIVAENKSGAQLAQADGSIESTIATVNVAK